MREQNVQGWLCLKCEGAEKCDKGAAVHDRPKAIFCRLHSTGLIPEQVGFRLNQADRYSSSLREELGKREG